MSTSQEITVGTIRKISRDYGYTGSVYRPANYEIGERWSADYTGENRAAHGGITYTQEESNEGRQRKVNVNGNHIEVGPWGPTSARREAHAKREEAKTLAAREAEEDAAAKALGVSVVGVEGEVVTCAVGGDRKAVWLSDIRAAAKDPHDSRLTAEQALAKETAEDRQTRLAYRSLLRRARR